MFTSTRSPASFLKAIAATVVFGLTAPTVLLATGAGSDLRQSPSTTDPTTSGPRGMVYVPGGPAVVGLDEKEVQELVDEYKDDTDSFVKTLVGSTPRHTVQLEPYYIDIWEVTNLQWQVYLEATGQEPHEELVKYSWKDGKIPPGEESFPIVCVSFREAEAFAKWAHRRLPAEEEWEFAARGPEAFRFPWGDEFDKEKAWSGVCTWTGKRTFQRVGTKPEGASPFGVLDMAGNVWEWTASPYNAYDDYKDVRVKTKINRGKAERYSAAEFFDSQKRVIRGGAFQTPDTALVSAVRQMADRSTWYNTLGFRCVRSARPGYDAAMTAYREGGPQYFADHPLDFESIISLELTNYNADDLITGCRTVVFAPVKDWGRLSEIQKDSHKAPQPVGVFSTTENMIEPHLRAGTYVVAYVAARKNGNGDERVFPDEGWLYEGWERHDPNYEAKVAKLEREKEAADRAAKKKAAREEKKKKKAKEEVKPAPEEKPEAGAAEESEEPRPEADVPYSANPGSVEWNRNTDNIVLLNLSGQVLAAYSIDELKDTGRPAAPRLIRKRVGEDKRRAFDACERYEFDFAIGLTGGKAVELTLPIRFNPDLFPEGETPAQTNAAAGPKKDSR